MVALGAYIGSSKVVELDSIKERVKIQFKTKPKLIDLNLTALQRGYDLAVENSKG